MLTTLRQYNRNLTLLIRKPEKSQAHHAIAGLLAYHAHVRAVSLTRRLYHRASAQPLWQSAGSCCFKEIYDR
jgi:hypothetical protein